MKRLPLLLAACLLVLPVLAQPAELGTTTFPNTGAEAAQEPFLRGLLLLHSFEYEDAREAFQEARALDPGFAMAAWGEAMTHNHPIWMQQDTEAAQAALKALAPSLDGRLAKAGTEREKDYLRAAETLFFGEASKHARDDAFAEVMARLADRYPDDLDATAFYALALLGTAHEGRDFRIYMQAAAEAQKAFDQNPQHPGAAHYLIHSFDDPIHAPLGLPAARAYSKIAPAAAHALHMPSHIFVARGMWDDVVAMNEASWQASLDRADRKNLGVTARSFHALQWLAYGYLQQGRYADARRLVGIMTDDTERSDGARSARSYLARMRATHLVDTHDIDAPLARMEVDTDGLSASIKAVDRFADGFVALHAGTRAEAEAALAALRPLADEEEMAAIMADELEALLLLDAGRGDEALALLQRAAATEDALPFDFGPPMPPLPAHEAYGEALLALGRAAEAQQQFALALERTPRRARALLGLARAAAAAGDTATAHHAYAELRDAWHTADADLPALSEVRATTGSR